ncbi:hypothetical protein I546_3616 [Mycobacterium kansasii 732]|uniref:Uncharacterized protein n=1 Tax=Mycobacterium pseudokansasii TaxID=2341080 RepID=A0A498QU69_9MYCO|nr:hypothetical protein [Mycobacterium pseudokansasii]EUA10575.1 hypothetical protein I546_3616 [Mycobacterium kansasii 732]MBY0391265.1 hypothetical protein [Mycobacterium pseudokansasii]VAZ97149.1 hypothetical protein LAUMK35_03566 [Mycobacterium pseudokansasii]VAZ98528.1 hypothetical protein LAUMK21_03563 [Mycobacterium pseudokansasii]VBA52233.1 hypothetical protein LAUMK142_03455 [Mycobacterium pseudokansasii]
MATTITLRLSDDQYDLVKRYAGQWMSKKPGAVSFAEAGAEQNLEALPRP